MAWADYVYVKLRILKNGNFYAEGKYKGFAVTASVLSGIVDDINGLSAGGNLLGVPNAYSTTANTWGFYETAVINTSPELKTLGIAVALENVGDELTFYNPDVGLRYALHIRRAADGGGGVRVIETAYTHAGTKSGYTTAGAYYGTDVYGRWRTVAIGFVTQDFGAYPFLMLAAIRSDLSTADLKPWLGFSASDFRSTVQYDYFFAISNAWQPPQSTDPYHAGGDAEDQLQSGPAPGSFDDTSDTISIPGAPALNLSLNHFISAYVPDLTTLNGLADFIWGNYDKFDSSKKLSKIFADPSDAIISLHMLPFEPSSSTAIEVTIGRYGSSISMPPLTAQFKDVSCGTLTIDPYWGNYLDHNPFTRYTLFIPFVGEVQLDPDEIVGETIGVDYRIDCLTGAFVCFVSTSTKILAQYQGNCSLQVPTSSADYSRLNSAILTAATAAVGAAVGVGAAAAGAAAAGAEAASGSATLVSPENAMNVMQSKVNHSHSGALGGASGFMGSQKPYLIIHRARQSVPADANAFKGYPCNAKFNLADLEGCGFTSVKRIKLDGIKLTEGELEELRQILAAGVYL